jgi:hypothetical protein
MVEDRMSNNWRRAERMVDANGLVTDLNATVSGPQ